METAGSTLTEEVLFEALSHVVSGFSEDHKKRRIEGLEAMYRRIESDSIQNRNETVRILLDMAKVQGNNDPESSLICDSLTLLINRHGEVFETILNGLRGKENSLFICFSKVVLSLNHNQKKESTKSLIDFLMSKDALNDTGVTEVYSCLVRLGNEELSKEVVKEVSPYLDSITSICAIIFSVRLCAKFAGLVSNKIDLFHLS